MPVDPHKLTELVAAERQVLRHGKQFMQHYWIRGGAAGAPAPKEKPPEMSDDDWNKYLDRRKKNSDYIRQYREKRKAAGKAKGPEDPPAPPPEKKPGEIINVASMLKPVRGAGAAWLNRNADTMKKLGDSFVEAFKTTPPDSHPLGVTGVMSAGAPKGFAAYFMHQGREGVLPVGAPVGLRKYQQGIIVITPPYANALKAAVEKKRFDTSRERYAAVALTHEMFHATSNSEYTYEGATVRDRPHAALQEATTELLAQTHYGKVARALGIDPDAGEHKEKPLFGTGLPEYGMHEITSLARPVAYEPYVRQFTRIANAIDETQPIAQHAEKLARVIKGTRGGMRYKRLADALVETRMDRGHEKFEAVVNHVASNILPDFIQSRGVYATPSIQGSRALGGAVQQAVDDATRE